QKVVMDVGRELQQMVSLSTMAEYVMSVDTVDLSGVKRVQFSSEDQKKALEKAREVEKEWLKLAGSEGQKLLALIKDAVAKYRSFTGK
ncbi:MAG: hypothetical protein KAV87_37285, partial [Desulfobacteraceae bacterium]|nr:hypothetical protein [Desulfobacteraceae bacterium]